jgi:capsular exopolysaccharide synthesis family protein
MSDSSQDGRGQSFGDAAAVRQAPLVAVWRHKYILIATVLIFTGVTAFLSKVVLEKEYDATATMWVTQTQDTQSFDAVQAGQVLARTYSDVIESENVAGRVADQLPFDITRGEVKTSIKVEAVPETQLLEITAVSNDPARAQLLANTYAGTVTEYARGELQGAEGSSISLADRAVFPGQPARPRPTLYTMLAGILGLVVGSALALLAAVLDTRVRSPEELAEIAGVPILAQVALARNRRARQLNQEAYRVLRTNLDFVRPGQPLRSVAVVSPSEAEGKSSAALNLARAIAETGDAVVVVEGDMRRPTLQAALVPDVHEPLMPGLSNYLSGLAELSDVIYPTDHPLISFLPSGPMPPAASALLDTERGRTLLRSLADIADVTVVDTPPLSVGADASLLASSASETIAVVDLQRSSKKAIRSAFGQLRLVGAELVGLILNRVRETGGESGYYYAEDPRVKKRRSPFGRSRTGGQLEGSPAPTTLAGEPFVGYERPDQDHDQRHDDVGTGRVLTQAGNEQPDQAGDNGQGRSEPGPIAHSQRPPARTGDREDERQK